jgi:hypothetical protein
MLIHKKPHLSAVLLVACLILAACNIIDSDSTPTLPTQNAELGTTQTLPPPATATTQPSQTPEPARMLLVAPSNSDLPQRTELENLLKELATSAGLEFEVRPVLTPADLTPSLEVVVVLPPDPGLAGLVAEAPDTQFLAIGIPGLEPDANLSLISPGGFPADQMGFLAGYLAAVNTPEWRVGMVGISDTEPGVQTRQGFLNGVVFFCGLCQQTYTPFYTYPMYVELPAAASPTEWQAAADVLVDKAVRTAFIAPGAGDDTLLTYLAEAGVQLIGTSSPPPGAQDQWVASITPDMLTPLETMWPELLAGKGGLSLPASLTLSEINPELYSLGRQHLVEDLMDRLDSGLIDTAIQPLPTEN